MRFPVVPRGRWTVLFGLLAMLAALLQPLCTAYAAARGADHGEVQCCAEIANGDFVAAPSTEIAKAPTASPVAAVPAFRGRPVAAAIQSYRLVAWNDPPPPTLRYHARSARIQR
jgi:hypothetical protein